ncbi:PREDICTED: LEAF RUST 10 DISEASE-RESISTANCE LOCUS RECEPTOR-LIKE PROTEIN KINASE-like 1.2 [Nelumbo nucifera]|uniref:LEAF RUST 10 DISEASE-RESISTANCE LOCUS RECEPTOR-LIKE PROTEIN KINASE-like 1.2 n=2 Tax=Nelumbo nucifera TaxID=4432 RepID=A0A1U8BQ53_NELNU|nr:PREDICTED: LEAF RUST 10 DISEASE-RESISTANCE LOCUS RECEPTOR-LIKE PROTEIN KINASE-like 1.2 [Nelumbo nucifera]DAD31908.1 TPA_asm: hypothetical protein HUJ06_010759 [Nelumbo nucifera]
MRNQVMFNRGVSTTLMPALLVFLLFFINVDVQARNVVQECAPSSCGNVRNISYPFRLKGEPNNCGDPDYELTCDNNNDTILELNSGRYYVKQISYDRHIIRVADINLSDGNCSLPNKSLLRQDIENDRRFRADLLIGRTSASFVNCSTPIDDPKYRSLPCFATNTSNAYVLYDHQQTLSGDSGLYNSCTFISVVPAVLSNANNPSYETIQKLLQRGFDLGWSVECRNCLRKGKSCSLSEITDPLIFQCDDNWVLETIKNVMLALLRDVVLSLIALSFIARIIVVLLLMSVFLIYKLQNKQKPIIVIDKFLQPGARPRTSSLLNS